ncbi:MAG: DNA mismatch repair protein MutS, partial [Lachnospiraceae bacterium]|nr:DNA mismatch repair protein MutS [Lachnospiraceae bacterium]
MGQLSPMMQKYLETKEQYKDCILFYRLGDFYEMFFDDAVLVSKELELTLTGKDCGLEERAPMCGIPYHAVETYLSRLVEKGYKVAIGEQVEDPKTAKGLVKREVVRVVTPGTNLCTSSLDETKNNYLMCVSYLDDRFGIAITDITTGDFMVTEVDSVRTLFDEINKFMPSELVVNSAFYMTGADINDLKTRLGICVFTLDNWYFDDEMCSKTLKEHFGVLDLQGLGLTEYPVGTVASGALMKYLLETQKTSLSHIISVTPYSTGKYMLIDTSTRRNLELTETLREKQKRGSLLWVLDKTKTAMGARTLRQYIEQPLINKQGILNRQDAILELNDDLVTREEIREYLNPIYDLERLIGKISYQSANPRDLIAFKNSLEMLPHIKNLMKNFQSDELARLYQEFDVLGDLFELIDNSIDDEPPIVIREGGIIKDGYSQEIDTLRKAKTEGKNWIAQLEA